MATPIDVVVLKCRKICPTGNWRNCALFTSQKNKISAPSQTVATARIVPKICQGQPPTFGLHCPKFHPNRFTFGRVIVEHMKAVLLAHRVFATFAFRWIIRYVQKLISMWTAKHLIPICIIYINYISIYSQTEICCELIMHFSPFYY